MGMTLFCSWPPPSALRSMASTSTSTQSPEAYDEKRALQPLSVGVSVLSPMRFSSRVTSRLRPRSCSCLAPLGAIASSFLLSDGGTYFPDVCRP